MLANWLGESLARGLCILLLLVWVVGKAIARHPGGAAKSANFLLGIFRKR